MFLRVMTAVSLFCVNLSLYGLNIEIDNTTLRTVYVQFTGDNLVVNNVTGEIAQSSSQTFDLTSVSSGRIYLSFDQPLSSDAPDGANPNDPDYSKRFDKVELTYANGSGMANLTSVDFYAIPLVLQTEISSAGIVIDQFTLASNTSGNDLQQALLNVAQKQTKTKITNSQETVRVLSPVKAPSGYQSLTKYVRQTIGKTITIAGNYYSESGLIPYNYTGKIGQSNVSLHMPGRQSITLKTSQLYTQNSANSNAIYTCNGEYYLSGSGTTPHHVSENDFYSAVYRDFIAGYNFGYIGGTYGNDSTNWWQNKPFFGANIYYNQYADVINRLYPGAYGFPFSDRQKLLLADLGGMIDTLKVTILSDDAIPPTQSFPGVLNPQVGTVEFNAVLISSSDEQDSPFTFGRNAMKFGWINDYHNGAEVNLHNGTAAQIQNIKAQEGYNQYQMVFGERTYIVILQVVNGEIQIATIAGGGNSNWSAPNLYIGGLQANP